MSHDETCWQEGEEADEGMMMRSVNRVVQSKTEKQVELEVLREEKSTDGAPDTKDEGRKRRERIAKRAAKELKEGVSLIVHLSGFPFARGN